MKIVMPQLGETVTEGTVATWHKKVGESVEKGELLLDIETDKVATEIEAPVSGVLNTINVAAGETVDVGTVLAIIGGEGEAAEEAVAPQSPKTKPSGERLSPAVRRLLKEHDLNVADIPGTGRDGRVTRDDVLHRIEAAKTSGAGAERIPFNRIRRVTAEHMLRSKATSPHVLQVIEADFSAVDQVRLAKREQWRGEHGHSLSYLPFVARALCLAITDFPRVNASVEGEALVVHRTINLAVAIDLDFEGLVAPVVKNAAELKVPDLALRIHQLAERAKAGKLSADDLRGGTYTLSNPGPYGTLFTAPIINQPQIAILSMDAVLKRPVVAESEAGDTVAIRPVGNLAHSFDHRAIDGAYSAAFLQRLKTIIERHGWDSEL